MFSEVFFAQRRATQGGGLLDKIEQLFDVAGFGKLVDAGDLVGLKLNFGERGNTTNIRPEMIKRVVKKVRQSGGDPFLTDCNRLSGGRRNAFGHLQVAADHGFSIHTVNAPVVIADGLRGRDVIAVEIDQKHFKTVKIASAIHDADALFVLNHFTGHPQTGFCGVLNNLGLGSASRNAVDQAGSELALSILPENCTRCQRCLARCPSGAISEDLVIDMRRCTACGDCLPACSAAAIRVQGKSKPSDFQEKMIEAFFGAVKNKSRKVGYMSFLIDITPDSDSWDWSDAPVVGDIGIIASRDPVALEQASIDFFNQQPLIQDTRLSGLLEGKDRLRELSGGIDWEVQLRYAEKLGLGTREYELFII
ncbi:MAG TPA: DUF362 domain-containing protein [Chroococcales cyanobacterium]